MGADANRGRILVNLEGQILRTLRERSFIGEPGALTGKGQTEGVSEMTDALEASALSPEGGDPTRLVGR